MGYCRETRNDLYCKYCVSTTYLWGILEGESSKLYCKYREKRRNYLFCKFLSTGYLGGILEKRKIHFTVILTVLSDNPKNPHLQQNNHKDTANNKQTNK